MGHRPPHAQVSRAVLEDVRAAKATTNKLLGRVQRVKQELEEILADDADMAVGARAALFHACFPLLPLVSGLVSSLFPACLFPCVRV